MKIQGLGTQTLLQAKLFAYVYVSAWCYFVLAKSPAKKACVTTKVDRDHGIVDSKNKFGQNPRATARRRC